MATYQPETWEELAKNWIAYQDSQETSHYPPAVELLHNYLFEKKYEYLWQFVLTAYKLPMSEIAFSCLAAGPLEDLLAHAGDDYIDEVEDLARKDPIFNNLLGGVWQNAMSDDVWQRLQKARLEQW